MKHNRFQENVYKIVNYDCRQDISPILITGIKYTPGNPGSIQSTKQISFSN